MKIITANNCNNKPHHGIIHFLVASNGIAGLISRFTLSILLLISSASFAQSSAEKDIAFRKVLTERSGKIVSTLSITKSNKKEKIAQLIAEQYYQLNKLHDNAKSEIIAIKASAATKDEAEKKANEIEETKNAQLSRLHKKFVTKLNNKLTDAQVEKVKDGMTYNVMNVTYAAYNDMILSLTGKHKEQILAWLKEAREKAMDEGSSDDKHKVFGKYKGRINNYLSAEGYDIKKEEKAWQQRLKEKREKEAAVKNIQSA